MLNRTTYPFFDRPPTGGNEGPAIHSGSDKDRKLPIADGEATGWPQNGQVTMRFNILGDFDWESKVDEVLDSLSESDYRSYFQERDYGVGLIGVTVVLMCQDPVLKLKRRVRLSKKEKKLYVDIMLDLPGMKAAGDLTTRKGIVSDRLLKEEPEVVSKYKISNFDSVRFIDDLRKFFTDAK